MSRTSIASSQKLLLLDSDPAAEQPLRSTGFLKLEVDKTGNPVLLGQGTFGKVKHCFSSSCWSPSVLICNMHNVLPNPLFHINMLPMASCYAVLSALSQVQKPYRLTQSYQIFPSQLSMAPQSMQSNLNSGH